MICAYDRKYLFDAMNTLGEMTEYAYHVMNTKTDLAMQYFMISGYSDRFQIGDPHIVSGMSGTELYLQIMDKCGFKAQSPAKALIRYDTDAFFWIGYIAAFYQWKKNTSFSSIFSTITTEDLIRMYPALHTVSEDRAFDSIEELYRSKSSLSRLQAYRKALGMTQQKLSDVSGVNLRTLQQYEIGSKDISKASASSILALSSTLHCAPADLIDN